MLTKTVVAPETQAVLNKVVATLEADAILTERVNTLDHSGGRDKAEVVTKLRTFADACAHPSTKRTSMQANTKPTTAPSDDGALASEESAQMKINKQLNYATPAKKHAPSFRVLVLLGVAAAFCAAFLPHMTESSVASKLAEANHPAACPPQWLPVILAANIPVPTTNDRRLTVAPAAVLPSVREPVALGMAEHFALLTKTGITTTGATSVTGDIGTSPITGAAMTGFGFTREGPYSTSALVTGRAYAADYLAPTPGMMTTAISNMETAYNDAAGYADPDTENNGYGDLNNITLLGGVHKWSTVVTLPVGKKLYFDAQGRADTVWIMQIAGGLNFMADSEVVLINEAKPTNIFWQVAGVATILADAHAQGIILCKTAITFGARGSLTGRGLAQTAVTMIATTINALPTSP